MAGAPDLDARLGELRHQLLRYRADRNPEAHAMVQFHLGTALLESGQPQAAERALRIAADLFASGGHTVELGKSLNMLGVVLRELGRTGDARDAFTAAATELAAAELPLEEGAARHNLGLVQRDAGRHDVAAESFRLAWASLREGPPGQASAAARELGATLLQTGAADEAAELLDRSIELASRAGDRAGMGAAANVLGLAQLARDDPTSAVEAFRTALACHPRRVRPEGYAMAKANLALALERSGDDVGARLSARQALATPDAPPAVVAQAEAVLGRLGESDADLHLALERASEDEWPGELRDELARWLDSPRAARTAAVAAWIEGQVARADRGQDLAAAYLGVLLELPPDAMELLIRTTIEALPDREPAVREHFRRDVSRAMARFNVPQWMRLKDTFNRLAADVGDDGSWG